MRPPYARPVPERARGYAFMVFIHVIPFVALLRGVSLMELLYVPIFYFLIAPTVGIALHRYFAHRSFKTSRFVQFLMGLSTTLTFTDPISFAGKHRLHHRYSDRDQDVHRPADGFWFCWFGSLIDEGYSDAEIMDHARDLTKAPELMWLHRWRYLPPILFSLLVWWLGGFTMVALGYFGAFALLLNFTSSVNYMCHRWGRARYETGDFSRNNWLVALWGLGEGWHNNHHHFPATARAGFFWWEFDPLYWIIKTMEFFRVVWDVRGVPDKVRYAHLSEKSG
jgi:stearoyl-CoA desaturase (delta-9 desaturase)